MISYKAACIGPQITAPCTFYLSIDLNTQSAYAEAMDKSCSTVFAALAEPTRLSIVDALAQRGELAAHEISGMFTSTPSAISQHLKVLRNAGIARVTKRGQQRVYSLDTTTLTVTQQWLQKRTALWDARLDTMEIYFEQQNKKEKSHVR